MDDFFSRLDKFMEIKGLNDNQMTVSAGLSVGALGKQRKGSRGLSSDSIAKILCAYPELNANWLLTGQGTMTELIKNTGISTGVSTGVTIENSKNRPTIKQSNEVETISLFGAASRTIDIPIVEISAAAGYGAINPDHAEHIGVIRLPESMVKQGTHYCIRIKGESMSPTLQDSDYLIIRRIEPQDWLYMPDEHIFIVVDRDGMAYVKRVKNRLKKGFIVLMSDNIDKSQYKNFNLQGDEIYNIFHAEWHFSAKMQNINDSYYNRLKSLEDTVTEQGDILSQQSDILKKVLQSIDKK